MVHNGKVVKKLRYTVGKDYWIQPKRTARGIRDGRVKVLDFKLEYKAVPTEYPISPEHALAEGGYTPAEYELLFENMYPNWMCRVGYKIEFMPVAIQTTIKDFKYDK